MVRGDLSYRCDFGYDALQEISRGRQLRGRIYQFLVPQVWQKVVVSQEVSTDNRSLDIGYYENPLEYSAELQV